MQFGLNGNKNANNKRRHTFRTSYEAELRGVIPNVIFNCVFFYKKKTVIRTRAYVCKKAK